MNVFSPSYRGHYGERVERLAASGALRYVVPLGRTLLALIFLIAAPGHFTASTIGYAAQQGVPLPELLVPLSGILAAVGALSVLLGYHARIGGWLLVLFLVPVTLMMHAFWRIDDAAAAATQQTMFLKNLAMLGAALLIAWFGAGPISLDERRALRAGEPGASRKSR
jgi:putative oxidoreductase